MVNADDFGLSTAVNQAVVRAHRQGILTSASLMMGGAACDEAVEMARQNPRLGVGLHLTLVCGPSVLPSSEIPGLVDSRGQFSNDPVRTGFRYFARPSLLPELKREIRAQFDKFSRTGLRLDHVNGHLHLHLHPTVLRVLSEHAQGWGIRRMRLTNDPLVPNLRLASGHWFYRLSH
ncbi:MAG: ChbG/HpnK family deacetylase, partial [Candidatus Omnitrophica bacterium]|nr:ChbG/HpnK family deacetylase [Candidatus Omnitrophota bacterium]